MRVTAQPEPHAPRNDVSAHTQHRSVARPVPKTSPVLPWDVRSAVFAWSLLRAPVWYLWHLDSLYLSLRMRWLPMVWSFAKAHCRGFHIFGGEAKRRATICGGCALRVIVPAGEYCKAQIQGCGCPVSKRYPFSKLPYLRRLRAWTCPIGAYAKKEPSNGN